MYIQGQGVWRGVRKGIVIEKEVLINGWRYLSADDYPFVIPEGLFNKTCHCVPNISRDRWLVNSGQSKFKPGWIAFDENRDRIDYSSFKADRALETGSWHETRSIHENEHWGISVEEAIDRE